MFGLGPMELGLILAICMVLFGAKRLPELGRGIAGFFTSFRREVRELESTIEEDARRHEREIADRLEKAEHGE